MGKGLTAKASMATNAPADRVWDALVNPAAIKMYMFGTNVVSDWEKGSSILWKGEWKGKTYQDRGIILQLKPRQLLQYSHYSPLSGLPDLPENYHTVTVELSSEGKRTNVTLSQDNNATEDERTHSRKNWEAMLTALKSFVEQ